MGWNAVEDDAPARLPHPTLDGASMTVAGVVEIDVGPEQAASMDVRSAIVLSASMDRTSFIRVAPVSRPIRS